MQISRWLYDRPYILVQLTTLFWAGNAIAGKIAVGHISPFLLTSLRWFVALIIIAPFAVKYGRSDWAVIKTRFVFLFFLGAVGFTLFNNLLYLALTSTSAVNVSIIQSSMPLFVFFLNAAFFSVNLTKYQAVGFPITIVGVLVIAFQGNLTELAEYVVNIGDVLALASVVAYGIFTAFLKSKPDIHWLSTMLVLVFSAFVTSIPFTLFESVSGNLTLPDLTGILVVIYTAVFAAVVAQTFWIRSIELIGSNGTSVFINLIPIFGTLLAVVFLGEQLYMFHVLGLLLIVSGIYIAQLKMAFH